MPWSVMVVKGLRSCLKHSPSRALQFLLGRCWLKEQEFNEQYDSGTFFSPVYDICVEKHGINHPGKQFFIIII